MIEYESIFYVCILFYDSKVVNRNRPQWHSVLDPDMKEKVRSGEAFRWTCPHCGNTANVNYTTLYHQMEGHVMIYLVFGDQEKAIEMMQGFYRDNEGNIVDADEDYRNRVVGTMNEFREKLMILDAGLDDRIIELMKLFILANL
ncbi:MAG: CpXC domain-containing protein [Lachnospiraceae bacterium]|nr:CpXC domain-containing protein [Lachnospiraceae bacterium]